MICNGQPTHARHVLLILREGLEVIGYFAYLMPILFLFAVDRPLTGRTAVAA